MRSYFNSVHFYVMFSNNERDGNVNMTNGQNQQYIGEEIFQLAAEVFETNVPLQNGIETLELQPRLRINIHPDRLIRMVIQGQELRYYAEIKAHVTKAQRLLLQMNRQGLEYPILLMTRYINVSAGLKGIHSYRNKLLPSLEETICGDAVKTL
jgi:hypothetical protein